MEEKKTKQITKWPLIKKKKKDYLKTNRIFLQLDIDMYFYQCQNCLCYTCKSASDCDIFQNKSYNHQVILNP